MEKMLNKEIRVFFFDGKQVAKRIGRFISEDNLFIFLETPKGIEAINKNRILRMELSKDGNIY